MWKFYYLTRRKMRGRPDHNSYSATWRMILVCGFACLANCDSQAVTEPFVEGEYDLSLRMIHTSHGVLSPEFNPLIKDYQLTLTHPYESVCITPEISDAKEYIFGHENYPLVRTMWSTGSDVGYGFHSTASGPSSMVRLPGREPYVKATITMRNPYKPTEEEEYSVSVTQSNLSSESHVGLTSIRLVRSDDTEESIQRDFYPSSYVAYVEPTATNVRLSVSCVEGNSLYIDGYDTTSRSVVSLARDPNKNRQTMKILCYSSGSFFGYGASSKYYTLNVYPDIPVDSLKPPPLMVDTEGEECRFDSKLGNIVCPSDGMGKMIRLLSHNDPAVRYTVESAPIRMPFGPTVEVRLLNGVPTIPFSTSGALKIVARGGRDSKEWKLTFDGSTLASAANWIGSFLAVSFLVLALLIVVVLTLTNMLGIGTPFGAANTVTNSAFLMQFFCFASSFVSHRRGIVNIVQIIKWTTFFWPLPWEVDLYHLRYSPSSEVFPTADGVPSVMIGDVLNLHNAVGCLFWSTMFFATFVFLRLLVVLHFLFWERNRTTGEPYTFPHRLAFGHWESRVLHYICFPITTASCMILSAPGAFSSTSLVSRGAEIYAVIVLTIMWSWIFTMYYIVHAVVRDEKVTWIWNSPVLDNGELETDEGYWSDVVCDQLNTHAVNRGILPSIVLPWKWTSTVADITPIVISGNCSRDYNYDKRNGAFDTAASQQRISLLSRGQEEVLPLGGTTTSVEVRRTRSPGCLCPGRMITAGLFRTRWMDILFSYEALTNFHSQVMSDTRKPFTFFLTAKACQLQGPYTAGFLCFFFDAVRVPFLIIQDLIMRSVVGLTMGICLALQVKQFRQTAGGTPSARGFIAMAVLYAAMGLSTFASLCYVAITKPYTRKVENFLFSAVLLALSLSSVSFMAYAIAHLSPSIFSTCCLWLTACVCVILTIYSCLIIISLIAATACPPMEESRFLESLSNCTMTIADQAEGWAVDMPAYSKRPIRSIKAVCQYLMPPKPPTTAESLQPKLLVSIIPTNDEPTLEFSVLEVKRMVQTGNIPPPIACVFAPSNSLLKYKSQTIYSKDDHAKLIKELILSEPLSLAGQAELAAHIGRVIQKAKESDSEMILSLTVIPPSSRTTVMEESPHVQIRSKANRNSKGRSRRGDSSTQDTSSTLSRTASRTTGTYSR